MQDVHAFIQSIIAGLSKKKPFEDRVYTDEPILRSAGQMNNYLPDAYLAMKAIVRESSPYEDPAAVFYKQAVLMAEFEDDCPCHERFLRYYPTYRALSDRQLRGYFTWRTQVRRGNIQKAATAYVFIYIYELLHLIGVDSPEEGFRKLVAFGEAYGAIDDMIPLYLDTWLVDFYVYYTPAVSQDILSVTDFFDNALHTLRTWDTHGDDVLYEALCALSTYHPESSRFVKAHLDDFCAVACRVYRGMAAHYQKRCKRTYFEHLFGATATLPYKPFAEAVFYYNKEQADRTVDLSPMERFFYRDGSCYRQIDCTRRHPVKELGTLLKAIDAMMRDAYGFDHPLKAPDTTKMLVRLIDDAITAVLKDKAEAARRTVTIDRSKLSAIRTGADITRDKLLIDEERDVAPVPAPPIEKPAPSPASTSPDTPLDDVAYRFLQLVLYGGDAIGFARTQHTPVSVLVDTINEAFYDEFADTVLACDGDTPTPLDDYIDELKGRINP